MRKRHSTPLLLAGAFAFGLTAVPAAGRPRQSVVPALWTKAVAIFEANKNIVPGSMTQTMEELGGDGSVKSRTESRFRFSPDATEKEGIKTEILSVVKDGKDVTAEQKKQYDEQRKKREAQEKKKGAPKNEQRSHSVSSNDSPFSAEVQKEIRAVDTGKRENAGGRGCAVFEFAYPRRDENDEKSKPYTVRGTAWIDEETGCPLRVDSTRDPLPRGAKRMSSSFLYETRPDGSCVLKEMLFEGEGGFLFIKKRFRVKAVFGDHWLYVEPVK